MLFGVNPLVFCIICLKEGFCEAGDNWREVNLVKREAGVIKLMSVIQHGSIFVLKNKNRPSTHQKNPKQTKENQKNLTQAASKKSLFAGRPEGSG